MHTPLLASLAARYLFENPWPTAALLAVAAGALFWRARTVGEIRPLQIGIGLVVAAICVVVAAALITTKAERGAAIVQAFVDRAERADTAGMLTLLTPDASFHYGRPENPGIGFEEIRAMLAQLESRYRIESNVVTQLDATAEAGDAATVLLTNRTSVAAGYEGVPNSWWLRVAKQADGQWKIERIAFLKVAAQSPTPSIWR